MPDQGGPVRLWVDRAFSMTGSGTVVTGTLPGGTVHRGDELVVTPSMRPVRVRDIQTLGESAPAATGVARVALNLRGVTKDSLARGMAIVQTGRWTATDVIDVRVCGGPGGPGPPVLQRRPGHAAAAHRDAAHRLGPDRGQGAAPVRRHRPAQPARPAAAARGRPGAAARPGRGPDPAPPPRSTGPTRPWPPRAPQESHAVRTGSETAADPAAMAAHVSSVARPAHPAPAAGAGLGPAPSAPLTEAVPAPALDADRLSQADAARRAMRPGRRAAPAPITTPR